MKKVFLAIICASAIVSQAQPRLENTLRDGWQFTQDGESWEQVTVPHDWAIAGPFDKKWDLQVTAIKENGDKRKTEHSGRTGALPWIGEGEYKTTFTVPKGYAHAELLFDGVMSEPVVYVNGKEAGRWAYGYNAFRVDATPYLAKNGKNELTVKVRNVGNSSRWYPGAGIYRPVKLILTGQQAIDTWGVCVRNITTDRISVSTQLRDKRGGKGLTVVASVMDANGKEVARAKSAVDTKGMASSELAVSNAKLWSPESPYLYNVVTRLYQGKKLIDEKNTRWGLRTVSFTKEYGFQLNGVSRKFRGVCLHHDLGPLGAANNKAAMIRQLRILKEMGCDAIRTAHNMPSTMQMELCDSIGLMVMAESFDSWQEAKVDSGYNRFWKDWWQKDVTNLVLNHRNHPSIVMWSCGNEIPEQDKAEGTERLNALQNLFHQLDPTRKVTCGINQPDKAIESGFAQTLDIPGYNYHTQRYTETFPQLPQGFLLGSETASTISSRGVYKTPANFGVARPARDGQCNSYDNNRLFWSNLPEDDWQLQDDEPWTIGEFVWTGFDYLGEPTPYDKYWPSRSSYFGIVDLAGIPKDRYYLYRSHWRKDSHTIHLLPHWNWTAEDAEDGVPVFCYTDYPSAELFVNGKSQGHKTKVPTEKQGRYRLMWEDVKYEPGEIKVVVYYTDGRLSVSRLSRRLASLPN